MLVDDMARDGGWAYDLPNTKWIPVLLRFLGFVRLVDNHRSLRKGVEATPKRKEMS